MTAADSGEPQFYRPGVRLAAGYFLDSAERMVRLSGQDLGPCLVFMGAVWANVQWAAEAAGDEPLPAQVERRPVSIYRLSDNLSMPYETVRRHVSRLVDTGYLVRDANGVLAPDAVFTTPMSVEILKGTWASTVKFRNELKRFGVDLPQPAAKVSSGAVPWVGRLSAAFVLAGIDFITQAMQADPVSGLIYLAVNRENLAPIMEKPDLARGYVGDNAIVPDALRRPASVYRIAKVLGLPYETARRHVLRLVETEWLARTADGALITPGATLTDPAMMAASAKAWPLVLRFLEQTGALGLGGAGDTLQTGP